MKRYFTFILMFFLLFSSCNTKKDTAVLKYNNFPIKSGDNVFIMLYYPPHKGKYIVPEARNTTVKKSIEYTLMDNLFTIPKTPNAKPMSDIEFNDISREGTVVYLSISSNINSNLPDSYIYSIVNTLTEVPDINRVIIKFNKKLLNKEGYIRNRDFFNRDKTLNPSQVLDKQMRLEQGGKWVDSYLLLSDRKDDQNRKYIDGYIREMQEMQDNNFLDDKFLVGDYVINGETAKVKVNFYTLDQNGKKILGKDLYFKCIRINGVWMVDWLTAQ